ncbi:MAG: TRAP transporter TatT component family protein [Bryobacteraceae bacterium]
MRFLTIASVATLLAAGLGCSVKRFAVNKVGDALASGGSTFETDEDLELVGAALPFSLKMVESLLAESPKHRGLLMTAASGFTQYSYAFVEEAADEALAQDLARSDALKARARRLYLRAYRYGLRGLDAAHPGFSAALEENPAAALAQVRKRDIPLLYWTAAAHGLAISLSRDDPEMLAQLPMVEAMVKRVAELDEGWNAGAVPEFLISVEAARVGAKPEEVRARMKKYFERSIELSGGARAAPFVSYAEKACVPAQSRAEFQALLEKALAIDPDRHPETRLANLVAQRRARWLLGRIDELFLDTEPVQPETERRTQ